MLPLIEGEFWANLIWSEGGVRWEGEYSTLTVVANACVELAGGYLQKGDVAGFYKRGARWLRVGRRGKLEGMFVQMLCIPKKDGAMTHYGCGRVEDRGMGGG